VPDTSSRVSRPGSIVNRLIYVDTTNGEIALLNGIKRQNGFVQWCFKSAPVVSRALQTDSRLPLAVLSTTPPTLMYVCRWHHVECQVYSKSTPSSFMVPTQSQRSAIMAPGLARQKHINLRLSWVLHGHKRD
jgi:hypothetical protein